MKNFNEVIRNIKWNIRSISIAMPWKTWYFYTFLRNAFFLEKKLLDLWVNNPQEKMFPWQPHGFTQLRSLMLRMHSSFKKNCLTCRSTTYKKRCFLEGPMESPIWGVWCRGGHFLNKSLFSMRKKALAFSFVLWTVLEIRICKGSKFVEPLDPNPDP